MSPQACPNLLALGQMKSMDSIDKPPRCRKGGAWMVTGDMIFTEWVLLILQIVVSLLAGYLLLLTITAFSMVQRLTEPAESSDKTRFAILIPAHNEELLLPGLLASLNALDYPMERFDIHVVADNCSDRTAAVAQNGGAQVHTRSDEQTLGKGPALQWLLNRIWSSGKSYDGYVILDADSIVSPNFLTVMSAHLGRGERVIQAFYGVRDPGQSWSSSLRYVALAVLHYLRPMGRMALGGSAGLKGNGMVFTSETLQAHDWSASITEDIELHMQLILHGERVSFAPQASVLAEMPNNLANAKSQHIRWECGRMEAGRRYAPLLLQRSWHCARRGDWPGAFLAIDAMLEFVIPPLSILFSLSLVFGFTSLLLAAIARLSKPNGFDGATWLGPANITLSVFILGALIDISAGRIANGPRSGSNLS